MAPHFTRLVGYYVRNRAVMPFHLSSTRHLPGWPRPSACRGDGQWPLLGRSPFLADTGTGGFSTWYVEYRTATLNRHICSRYPRSQLPWLPI